MVPDGAVLVANGKQALSLVAQELRERGVLTVLAPDHYCLTMIPPFQLEGLRVRHLPTDALALLDAEVLRHAIADDAHQAVLHCEVYGARAGERLLSALTEARAHGVPVVVDATHSLLAAAHDPGDYLVASLRKLLPVPDGGFALGVGHPALPERAAADEAATQLALTALELGRKPGRSPASVAEYLDAIGTAEEAMLDLLRPVAMSGIALQWLRQLDVQAWRQSRRAHAAQLIAWLIASGHTVLNADTAECGVVVRVRDAPAAEQALLEAGVICPISWPRPEGLPQEAPWRSDLVTLPVDRFPLPSVVTEMKGYLTATVVDSLLVPIRDQVGSGAAQNRWYSGR